MEADPDDVLSVIVHGCDGPCLEESVMTFWGIALELGQVVFTTDMDAGHDLAQAIEQGQTPVAKVMASILF